MDSLTQITLGAAVGEAVLGRKIGNRAMVWGAIGGTIPDLDVLGNIILTPAQALAFHRGISHSIFFGLLFPLGMAWLVRRYYHSTWSRSRRPAGIGSLLLFGLYVALAAGLMWATANVWVGLAVVAVGYFVGRSLWGLYRSKPLAPDRISYWQWYALFAAAILTHPLLDAFTPYGTQLLLPFSDARIAWNTISVVDPIYTVPFLTCVVIASTMLRSQWRTNVNILGLLLSSVYLAFTVWNHDRVKDIFAASLTRAGHPTEHYQISPTIGNNLLWQGVSEGDEAFYLGTYSIMSERPVIDSFLELPKNHDLLTPYEGQYDVETVQWFSKGFYNVVPHNGDTLQVNDLRYGTLTPITGRPDDHPFKFYMIPDSTGTGQVRLKQGPRPSLTPGTLERFWEAMMGR